ncbi:glycosyltransferase [Paenibacillus sp. YAF4_2]|uniref:glycosyltransferase n=1 Tax=Paenibacillus sp. YAF4_2 TaxID=3233085 RepID=UPI003F957AB5
MKIVHICLAGPVTDGWNYQDNMITKCHKTLGYEVTMITSQWVWGINSSLEKYTQTNYINSDGVKVIRLPLKGNDKFTKKFKKYLGLREHLENESPNILFIHNISFMDITTIVSYLKRNQDVKVYVDNHADFSNSATNWISKNIIHKIIWKYNAQLIAPFVEKFYGVLPARVDFLVNIYGVPREKCDLLVMGADDEKVLDARNPRLIQQIREVLGVKDTDFLVITGGKIDQAKTQTLLLMEAISNINIESVKLVVFGSVDENIKDQLLKLVNGQKIQYIGWIDSQESYKYFAAADLVVFPGRHSVFWEQVVGQGKPLLCKYWEGTTHVDLGGNVEFIYQDTATEIESKIRYIIENPEYYRLMKETAEEKGLSTFSYMDISRRSIIKDDIKVI